MHAPTSYERYLFHERMRYGWESDEENDFPAWLVLEEETYGWMFSLSRKMYCLLRNRNVSKQMLDRIGKIPTIRFLRYRDISPSLKEAVISIASEFASLNVALKQPEMWKKPHLLSKLGTERWGIASGIVTKCLHATPDPLWRENWEKEQVRPYCTRREAEILASEYILANTGSNLEGLDPGDGKHKYYTFCKAKDGIFKLRYGVWGKLGDPYHDYGVVIVNMLTREIRLIDLKAAQIE